jgi:hypothetical protein
MFLEARWYSGDCNHCKQLCRILSLLQLNLENEWTSQSLCVVYFLFYDVCVKNEKEEIRRRVSCISKKWENMYFYFFSVVRNKIVCLICSKGVSVPKEYNLRRHHET